MLDIVLAFLYHTPWWVYLILFYCLTIGFKCSKDSISPLWKLFIIPVIFGGMSIHTLIANVHLDEFSLTVYFVSLLIGITLGAIQLRLSKVEVDAKHLLIKLHGTWSVMIIILIIFASKYWFGYKTALDPNLYQNTHFEIGLLFVSAVTSGIFIGKLFYCLFRLMKGPSVDLSPKKQ